MNYAITGSSASLVYVMAMVVTSLEAECVYVEFVCLHMSQTKEEPSQVQDETK